jgi:hypothetical protein
MFSGPRAKTLFHRFEISFARGARHSRKLNSAGDSPVTIPLAKHLFFQAFRSGIVTASGDTFNAGNIL